MKQEHSELLQKISGIKGCVSKKEAVFLYNAAKNCKGGVIVEIGSWRGKSTICLGFGSKNGHGAKVYAIDPHRGSPDQKGFGQENSYDVFKKNIRNAGLEDIVEPIVSTSFEAVKTWDKPIGFIFVDANYHDYENTKKDFFQWSRHLVSGGIYALHNTVPSVSGILEGTPLHGCQAPRQFMEDFIYGSNNFKNLKTYGTITAMEKAEKINLWNKIKNRLSQLKSRLLYLNHKIYLTLASLPQPIKKPLKWFLSHKTIPQLNDGSGK